MPLFTKQNAAAYGSKGGKATRRATLAPVLDQQTELASTASQAELEVKARSLGFKSSVAAELSRLMLILQSKTRLQYAGLHGRDGHVATLKSLVETAAMVFGWKDGSDRPLVQVQVLGQATISAAKADDKPKQ